MPSFAYAPLKPNALQFSGIVRGPAILPILARIGLTLPELKQQARSPDFRAFPLEATVSVLGAAAIGANFFDEQHAGLAVAVGVAIEIGRAHV
mgnify:CR=1 FL=1